MSKSYPESPNRGPIPLTSITTALKYNPPIGWIQVASAGGGGLVVKDEGGTVQTYVGLVNGQTLYGPFTELTSMSLTSMLAGDGQAPPPLVTSVAAVSSNIASVAAMAALTSAANGQQFQSAADGTNWRYVSTSVLTDDGGFLVKAATGIGVGAFLRTDPIVDIQLPVTFATADATTLYTVPAGWRLRLTVPYWSVGTTFTTSSSGAAGLKSSNAGLNTAGDILGGASGDLVATLVSTGAYAKGTVGAKIGKPAAVLSGGDTLVYNLIAGTYTAGVGIAHLTVEVLLAPAA